nr:hypothetical protein CFP56_67108 [Quercus suber]
MLLGLSRRLTDPLNLANPPESDLLPPDLTNPAVGHRYLFLSVCVIDRWTLTTAPIGTATGVAGEPFLRHDGSLGF